MEEWIRKARKGDADAFLAVLQAYEADMYRAAFVHVKRKEDALDVMQEAAYRAFRGIRGLKNEAYAKTWLIRIVINCARDHLKKTGREEAILSEEMEDMPDTADTQEGVIRHITLERLFAELNAEERQAVVMKYAWGYSFAEMADMLDRPLGTVKTMVYRALEKLRKNGEAWK